jgi:ketosteroid isomerase-like protein
MPATEPEQIHGLCEQAFNAGDLEALVALYEPDAALIPQPGTMAEGTAAIRDSLRWFPDRGGPDHARHEARRSRRRRPPRPRWPAGSPTALGSM